MKRILLVSSLVLLSMNLNAQVGINAGDNPKATLEVGYDTEWAKSNKEQGVIPPKLTTEQRNAMQGIHEGLMIYNTTVHCLQVFNGTIWSCTDGSNEEVPPVTSVATAILGPITPLRWVALEYNGTYYSYPQNGIASNESITVSIPYRNATNGTYRAYEQNLTLPDIYNFSKAFKLSYPAGTINSATGTIMATLTNISGNTYYPQPQTPNGQWQDLATTQVTFNGASETPYLIQVTGGIPDRCFGQTTEQCVGYGANVLEHQFVYLPVTGPDGKTWLNNNLGASYANVNSSVFNPIQQAKSYKDYNAYGSLFQWQRNPDGHELMVWANTGSHPKYVQDTRTLVSSWEAGTNLFFTPARNIQSWNYNSAAGPNNLWQANGANNPCPEGYHVPTQSEIEALATAIEASQSASDPRVKYANSPLHMPTSGYRFWSDAQLKEQNDKGLYWSSEVSGNRGHYAWSLIFYIGNDNYNGKISDSGQALGFSVRCLKD